jgi:hypothetical protein
MPHITGQDDPTTQEPLPLPQHPPLPQLPNTTASMTHTQHTCRRRQLLLEYFPDGIKRYLFNSSEHWDDREQS